MHTYRKSAASDETPEAWTVGIWSGSGWMSVRDFPTEEGAAAYCNYLGGGDGKPFKPAETEEPQPIEEAPELDELAAASDHFADDDAEDHEDHEEASKPRPSASGHRRRRK